jgi:hypothetical protein
VLVGGERNRQRSVRQRPERSAFGFLAGSDRQDLAKDLFTLVRQRGRRAEDFATIDINVLQPVKETVRGLRLIWFRQRTTRLMLIISGMRHNVSERYDRPCQRASSPGICGTQRQGIAEGRTRRLGVNLVRHHQSPLKAQMPYSNWFVTELLLTRQGKSAPFVTTR